MFSFNPIISIIIPVYNRPKLVSEAIDSVLAQTNPNWELIVVDDQSTDTTWEVLQEYSARDDRIRVFKRVREPKGAPTCRNIGIEMATGKYSVFWDSDDLMAPWCLEDRIRFMEKNFELDFGLFQLLNYMELDDKFNLRCNVKEGDYLMRFITFQNVWGTPAAIWKTSSIHELPSWNENALSWQDPIYHINALLKDYKHKWGSIVPDGLVRNLASEESITNNKQNIKVTNHIEVSGQVLKKLNKTYQEKFISAMQARFWSKTLYTPIKIIRIIANVAHENGFFTQKERDNYLKTSTKYWLIKKIPVLRRNLYFQILNLANKWKFYGKISISSNIIVELEKKIENISLSTNNNNPFVSFLMKKKFFIKHN